MDSFSSSKSDSSWPHPAVDPSPTDVNPSPTVLSSSPTDSESRDIAAARWLLGDAGRAAVAGLPPYRSQNVFTLTSRLRHQGLDADQTAAALTLSRLRERGTAKFGERSNSMFFTADGYEQATRLSVGSLHAARFIQAGVKRIVDFGCGVGADSLAFSLAGLEVTSIEAHPIAALYAAANVPEARVICADGLTIQLPEADAIWLDPARRTGSGKRVASPEAWTPPLSRALEISKRYTVAGIKAAPGIAHADLPADALVEWIGESGDLLEAVIWLGMGAGRVATIDGESFDSGATAANEPVAFVDPRPLGTILVEPDPAIIRSGGIAKLCERYDVAPVSDGIAYLSGTVIPPHCAAFEILDLLAPDVKAVKRALTARGIGRVEVKKRGIDVDVETVRKKLPREGAASGVVLFSPVMGRRKAILARRISTLETTDPNDAFAS
mgnify:CR=1 FL=1